MPGGGGRAFTTLPPRRAARATVPVTRAARIHGHGGAHDVAAFDQVSHPRRGAGGMGVRLRRRAQRHRMHREAAVEAQASEQLDVACAAASAREVLADHQGASAQALDQDALHQILRALLAGVQREGQHQGSGQPLSSSQATRAAARGSPAGGARTAAAAARGWGSKVSATVGMPSASPLVLSSCKTRRWPRCTPSKIPIETAAPGGSKLLASLMTFMVSSRCVMFMTGA